MADFYKKDHPEIPWSRAAAMRNCLVHDYNKVDYVMVFKTIKEDLPTLKVQLEKLLED